MKTGCGRFVRPKMKHATIALVVAVRCQDEMSCYAMWHALLEHGVYVNMAIPPGTPGGLCLLRCSVSAAHTSEDIDEIIALFGAVVSKAPRRAAANG